MNFLHTAVSFIVALGVLIVVHEYGHYLAARLCNVKVLRFSVGFGRSLATWKVGRDATEWTLAVIPFGGYVKMLDEREAPVEAHEAHRAFNRQGVARRVLIVIAGPVFNFIFAIAVYAGLFMHGLPEARPVLAEPVANSTALAAGFHAGDTVRSVNGETIVTWQDFRWRILKGAFQREVLSIEVANDSQQVSINRLDLSSLETAELDGDVLTRIGMSLYRPQFEPVLGEIESGSRAQAAGLVRGDRVVRVDGKPMRSWQDFVKVIQQNPEKSLELLIEREGRSMAVQVTPGTSRAGDKTIGRIGAGPRDADKIFMRISYGPAESVVKAVQKTWEISIFSLKMLGKMLVGDVSWKHLSGPVTIAEYAGQSAQMGWVPFATFLALISISLGVLNLLPIPLLDGGHLMYYSVEIIKGSPVSERAMELGQRVGLALLLVVMAFAFYNDLNRLFSG